MPIKDKAFPAISLRGPLLPEVVFLSDAEALEAERDAVIKDRDTNAKLAVDAHSYNEVFKNRTLQILDKLASALGVPDQCGIDDLAVEAIKERDRLRATSGLQVTLVNAEEVYQRGFKAGQAAGLDRIIRRVRDVAMESSDESERKPFNQDYGRAWVFKECPACVIGNHNKHQGERRFDSPARTFRCECNGDCGPLRFTGVEA